MAERRMFNKSLMLSNGFARLSKSAQLLYMYLCLQADDDGFADNTEPVCRMCRCTRKHLQELIDGGWVIPFDSGITVITHWHRHNQIKKDRYKPTVHLQERSVLEKKPTGEYVRMETEWIQSVSNLDPQGSIGKDSIGQDSIDKYRKEDVEEKPSSPSSSSEPPGAACDDIDYEKVLYYYQLFCPSLAPCEGLTERLRKKIRICHQMGYSPMGLIDVFMRANTSAFLQGDNARGWQADLGWLLEPLHLEAVHAGKYDAWT